MSFGVLLADNSVLSFLSLCSFEAQQRRESTENSL